MKEVGEHVTNETGVEALHSMPKPEPRCEKPGVEETLTSASLGVIRAWEHLEVRKTERDRGRRLNSSDPNLSMELSFRFCVVELLGQLHSLEVSWRS